MATLLPPVIADLRLSAEAFNRNLQKARADMAATTAAIDAESAKAGGAVEKNLGRGATKGTAHLQALQSVGRSALMGIAGAAVVVGGASVKLAANFQEATTQLVTGAGESEAALAGVRQGILSMAGQVAQTPQQLAQGLYMIESAGYHGAAGLAVLKASAQGAKVGGADMATVADATTTVLKDFGMSGKQASTAVNFLVSTVSQGKTHMQDLAGAMATVLPTASALKVPLSEVGGAMATLTAHGTPAANAATYLRMTMLNLVKPSSAAAGAMESIGLTADQVRNTLSNKGFLATVQLIQDHLGKTFPNDAGKATKALAGIAGGARGAQALLGLTGSHMGEFTADTAKVSDAMKNGKGEVIGWKEAQKDLNVQLDSAKASVEAIGIKLGDFLIPKVEATIKVVKEVVDWFGQHKVVAEALAGVIGGTLSVAIAAFAYGKAVDFAKSIGNMVKGVGALISKMTGLGGAGGGIDKVGTSAAGALDGSATRLQGAKDGLTAAATKLSESATQLSAAAEKLATAGGTAATEMEGGAATAEGSLAAGGASASGELAAGGATAEEELAAGGATAEAELSAGGATAAAEEGAGGAGGLTGGAKGVLGKAGVAGAYAVAGQVGGNMIQGKAGSSGVRTEVGDVARGAGLGAAVGSVVPVVGTALGAAVGGLGGAIFGIVNKGNDVTPSAQLGPASLAFLEDIASGKTTNKRISKSDAKQQLHAAAVKGYARGGWIPGAPGTPQLIMAHGGEYVESQTEAAQRHGGKSTASSGGITVNVYAETNASADDIARKVAWQLKRF